MSRLNIAPTKSNQLSLRRDLGMATEGYNLLEQKREILVMELMRLLEHVRRTQAELQERQRAAYETFRKAVTSNGYYRMCSVAGAVAYDHSVQSGTRVVAGVRVPQLAFTHGSFRSQFGLSRTDSLADLTMQEYLNLLPVVSRMAALETAVWILARELKKTQRRVNALEQIFIPNFRDTLRYIVESLESKELESFFVLKMIKTRLRDKE
jgi:V/A-type H+-transporting ATPase subunit D